MKLEKQFKTVFYCILKIDSEYFLKIMVLQIVLRIFIFNIDRSSLLILIMKMMKKV